MEEEDQLRHVVQKLKRGYRKSKSKVSKKSESDDDQSLIEFTEDNEAECARLLSNDWAPLKRRKLRHSSRI